MLHWHIFTAMPGYIPDGDEPPHAYITVEDVCNGINEELKRAAEFASDGANNHDTEAKSQREAGDLAAEVEAWRLSFQEREREANLYVLAQTYNTDRKDSPIYVAEPLKWAEEMTERIAADFPHYITENTKLYVEECEVAECVEDEADA